MGEGRSTLDSPVLNRGAREKQVSGREENGVLGEGSVEDTRDTVT